MTKEDIPTPQVWWNFKDTSNVTLLATAANATAWERSLTSLLQLYDVHDLVTAHDPARPKACRSFLKLLEDSVEADIKPIVSEHTLTHEAFAALKKLVPSDARAFEDMNIKSDVNLMDHNSTAAFINATRNVHQQFVAMDPTHHYSQNMTYMYRILRGIASVPELNSVRLKYTAVSQVNATTIIELYRDITDTYTPSSANAFAAQRSRPTSAHAPNGTQPYQPGVLYQCMLCRKDDHTSQECVLLTKLWENQRLSPKGNIFYSRNARKVVVTRPRAGNPNESKGSSSAHAAQAITGATLSPDEALQRAADKFVNEHAAQSSVNAHSSYYAPRTLFDTAASVSMVRDPLPDHVLHQDSTTITMADGHTTKATAQGIASHATTPLRISLNTLVVPHMTDTLLSGAQVAAKHDVLLQGSKLYVLKHTLRTPPASQICATGRVQNGIYVMDKPTHTPNAPVTAASVKVGRNTRANQLLHQIFNHISSRAVNAIRQSNPQGTARITGDQGRPVTHTDDCAPCHQGKQTRAPFPRDPDPPPRKPLDIVSTDTAGPLPITHHKNRYMQVLIDRATKKLRAVPLQNKSQATDRILEGIMTWQRLTGRTVGRYHSDNAKELQSARLLSTLKTQGTVVTTTTPHSSQQNPDAERAIRAITDATRCALHAARMSTQWWDYAAVDASDKYNHIPQKTAQHSPEELFTSTKPAIHHFQPFGQPGFVTVTGQAPKLAPRAKLCRYLRALNEHQYEVLDLTTDKVIKCRVPEFAPTTYHNLHIYTCGTTQSLSHTAHSARTPPATLKQALKLPDADAWAAAHDAEIRRHDTELHTWRYETQRSTDKPLPYVFNYKTKTKPDGTIDRYKARCAIRGDRMIADEHYDPTHASGTTPSHTARRVMLAAAAAEGHSIESYDVPGAYPRADADPRYRQTMRQPPRSDGSYSSPGKICVIQKAMQGAPDAQDLWERHRDSKLTKWGWIPVPVEPAAFTMPLPDGTTARLLADTDDFLCTAPPQHMDHIRRTFEQEWDVTIQRLSITNPIQHTGLMIAIDHTGTITVTNAKTIQSILDNMGMTDCNPAPTPHVDNEDATDKRRPDETAADQAQYMKILGGCRFVADTTHPKTAYIAGVLGRHLADPAARHMTALKRLVRYLKHVQHSGMKYRRHNDRAGQLNITAYCDSDYAQCRSTRKSTTGILIEFDNAIVHYTSCLQGCVALSSTEAEYMSAAHAAKTLSWIRQLTIAWRIKLVNDTPTLRIDDKQYRAQPGYQKQTNDVPGYPALSLRIDNKGAIDVAHANGPTKRTKHVDVRYHYVQQQVRRGELRLEQVPTTEQRSDFLTKALRRVLFNRACNGMNC